ncbi:response regulator transcription factor [Ostreibacterium oceani]|uniref:Response regulator n=1 Tax=Ostreibacterium oceani TaxID=2654998 RepID=A0A6N7EUQ8_9GAMM|nr:response regulator [Ostreibacterium oceani]
MRILLIEDDSLIGTAIEQALKDTHYSVDWVSDGQSGLLAASTQDYHLILLDLGLPKIDGLKVLKEIRSNRNHIPVIIITARDAVEQRIQGLDAGADDYLIKPFRVAELQARIRAIIRRGQEASSATLTCNDLTLDAAKGVLYQNGDPIALSAREFAMIRLFMSNPDRLLNRNYLEEQLYGWSEEVSSNAVEFIIHALRKKLGKDSISNIRGMGWMISRKQS